MMSLNHMRIILSIFAALLFFSGAAHAQLEGFPLNIKAQLQSETDDPAPGSTFTIAIVMTPDEGWHGYWENPGDAGVGLQLNWTLPDGISAGKPRFPIPEKLIISDLMNFTYEGQHSFLIDFEIDESIDLGTAIPISVEADWLACTDRICVPERDTLSMTLYAGQGTITSTNTQRFGEYRSKLAVPLDQKATYQIKGKEIAIAIPLPSDAKIENPYFFPKVDQLINYQAQQRITRDGDMMIITTMLDDYAPDTFTSELGGVMQIGPDYGIELIAEAGEVEGGFGMELSGDVGSIVLLLLSAIIGGVILNLMPCVFPIIGLKALSLAKLGQDDKAAKREALSYSGGVIFSTMVLGAALLLLRAGGEQIGWAFQLQSPVMIFGLFILMVLITFNLMGIYELSSISAGQKLTQGSGGSFWTGVLAAFVATPCTGPFMAVALGAALILPTYQAMLLFFGLGFGLALPYLLIAYVRVLREKMPRPGNWMETFRKVMAIPMALTAGALFWLLGRVGGSDALLIGVAAFIVTFVLAMYVRNRQKQNLKVAVASIILAAGVWVIGGALIANTEAQKRDDEKKYVQTQPYDARKLAQYRQEGKSVFLYFTADWCVTCKINEAAAIQREDIAATIAKHNIVVMEGDFTRRDPEIANALNEYGRSGVPLYLHFQRDSGPDAKPTVLPQLLSVNILDEAFTP